MTREMSQPQAATKAARRLHGSISPSPSHSHPTQATRAERDQSKAHQMDSSALTKLGLGALAFNSALAVYNSWGDTGSIAFVLLADAALLLLFLCLRRFERARGGRREEDGGGRMNNSKGAALAALAGLAGARLAILEEELKAMFASGVAALMPPLVAAAVWAVAVATVGGGFWAFFAPQ
ncbi:hypothetical protein U9M48_029772 [Paspalum notatum var. saurae]|uniref:Uncharacterized protein n=1 Tax=Paspalum notatum var. saurae TaxID=547442 RepID=A0AAQ3TZK1_PASNO